MAARDYQDCSYFSGLLFLIQYKCEWPPRNQFYWI